MKTITFIILISLYGLLLFGVSRIYSYVYDLEPRNLWEEYVLENKDPDISVVEWLARQDEARERALDWLGDGCAETFDPWYESPYSYGHSEGD